VRDEQWRLVQSTENDNLHHRVRNENATIRPPSIPKSGFRTLHACTTCGSTCGKDLVACARCGVLAIIGWIQSISIPAPVLAPLGKKPAWVHAAVILAQGCQGSGTGPCASETLNVPLKRRPIRPSVMVAARMTPPMSLLECGDVSSHSTAR
jgi:hypothetical protein